MLRALAGIFLALAVMVCAGNAAWAEKRVALVIGNGSYQHAPKLENPSKDAAAMAETLRRLGFSEVRLHTDLTQVQMLSALRVFGEAALDADWAVVFYAGHGMQVDGQNYLIPSDAKLAKVTDIEDESVPLERVLSKAREARKLRLVILDACRVNPFAARMEQVGRKRALGRGLAAMEPGGGELIAYAARDGQLADDGVSGHSPFTAALLQNIEEPGLEVNLLFRKVRGAVLAVTGKTQEPFVYGSLPEEAFYFKAPASAPSAATPQAPLSVDAQAWIAVQTTTSEGVLEEFVRRFPDSVYAGFAKARLEELKKARVALNVPPKTVPVLPKPQDSDACGDGLLVSVAMGPRPCIKPGSGESFRDCPDCPEMVIVPSGVFRMGSLETEGSMNESPQHRVAIAKPFAAGKFAVTFAEWDACVDAGGCAYIPDDKGWGRADRPVINVSWDDAKVYLAWLSKKTGKTYRLLSEAEREYVARAGTAAPFWWGTSIAPEQANYDGSAEPYKGGGKKGEYRQKTVPVKSFKPNPWGLYQVHGNVWEWVDDCWNFNYSRAPGDGSSRTTGSCGQHVVRGGSWGDNPGSLRAAFRNGNSAGDRDLVVGFRVARTLTP